LPRHQTPSHLHCPEAVNRTGAWIPATRVKLDFTLSQESVVLQQPVVEPATQITPTRFLEPACRSNRLA
ncbi:MAG: hypothetical protein ACO4AJ_04050, partial [Prochlorothrix sp.]